MNRILFFTLLILIFFNIGCDLRYLEEHNVGFEEGTVMEIGAEKNIDSWILSGHYEASIKIMLNDSSIIFVKITELVSIGQKVYRKTWYDGYGKFYKDFYFRTTKPYIKSEDK